MPSRLGLSLLALLLSTCRSGAPPPPAAPSAETAAPACVADDDCVPASCCHPSSCVPRDRAPDCGAVLCTMECRPATLDCGGGCVCRDGQCAARLNDLGRAD
jgi:hypothetical protein